MIILPRLVPSLHDEAVRAVGESMASDLVVMMDLMFQLGVMVGAAGVVAGGVAVWLLLVARRRGVQHGD